MIGRRSVVALGRSSSRSSAKLDKGLSGVHMHAEAVGGEVQ